MDVYSTENTEVSTTEFVERKMTEHPVRNVDTEEEMTIDDLTIPGDYGDSDIFEEEKESVS